MIFTVGKISFKLSFSFAALIVLMVILYEERIVIYSLVSSLIHESGHLLFMILSGEVPKAVYLTLFGMRIDRTEGVLISYRKEILISLGGIILNILFSVLFLILYSFYRHSELPVIAAVNLIIALVNALPVSALDLGRAIRYALYIKIDRESTEKCLKLISVIFIMLFSAFTAVYTVFLGINVSLIVINLYLIFITVIKKWS